MNDLWKKTPSSKPNLKKLCATAAISSAPRFYITPKQALEKYNQYKRTGTLGTSSPLTKQMYLCIFDRYEKAFAQSNGIEFKYSVMQEVLESPAPSFYITPSAAIIFFYRAMAYKRSLSRK